MARDGIRKGFQFFVGTFEFRASLQQLLFGLFSFQWCRIFTNPRTDPTWSSHGVTTTLAQNCEPSFRLRHPSSSIRPDLMAVSSSMVGFPIETSPDA